jgi:spermidine synthase
VTIKARTAWLAPMLFASGACALVYQTAWMRELRLIFGASTPANAAVLAIFMAGLGLGAARLGPRVDAHPRPLAFYGLLEVLVSAAAALTPLLLEGVRLAYVALGGSSTWGAGGATALRLLFAAFVLAVPTVAMGATLPAAARAVTTAEDPRRIALSVLYGANALGAVVGASLGTFVLFEAVGTRTTLWLAAALNLVLALVAWRVGMKAPLSQPEAPVQAEPPSRAPGKAVAGEAATTGHVDTGAVAPEALVLGAAALVGFVFFLMELVWYRMLAPLLGGSTFTFGLILAVALLGIGSGSLAYRGVRSGVRPTVKGFALSCALEAVVLALPLALGDRVAVLATMLRGWSGLGFGPTLAAWSVVAGLVVFPAAFIAGLQFPLLVGLLGSGERALGRQVGRAYALNTAGAIVGSLAGGFGLIPLLGAVGAWRLSAALLLLAAGTALAVAARSERSRLSLAPAAVAMALGLGLVSAPGPTAFWRHSPIGAGRDRTVDSLNALEAWQRDRRRQVFWERDGRESSIAMARSNGVSFEVNGKSDGHALLDASTQVMGGLLGALLHPSPSKALVVGLGTGSTAGWLAALPGMERVDVVEIEPAMVEVARVCAPVNQRVLENPKVRVIFGDAREVLMTARERYDIVFSEPSNPFRAGIASLFTREFYAAVRERLAPGGVFLQWLQAYEVDVATVGSVYATLVAELPAVQSWVAHHQDLILVASATSLPLEREALRSRMAQEPLRTALARVWHTDEVEGVLAHFVGDERLSRALAARRGVVVNSDDRPSIEFAFARTVGLRGLFEASELRALSQKLGADRPPSLDAVDWSRVKQLRLREEFFEGRPLSVREEDAELSRQLEQLQAFQRVDFAGANAAWVQAGRRAPRDATEKLVVAAAAAQVGAPDAAALIAAVDVTHPTEAQVLRALLAGSVDDAVGATEALLRAYQQFQADPWALRPVMERALMMAPSVARVSPEGGRQLFEALAHPFVVFALEEKRHSARMQLATALGFERHCVSALAPLEPWVPWRLEVLSYRERCYRTTGHPLAAVAQDELRRFQAREVTSLERWLSGE